MIIRCEEEKDFKNIYDLVKTAFQTAKVSDGTEQDFVNELRSGENYIQKLALVAEDDNKLIGHIMLTKLYINGENKKFEELLLAPICIALEYRNKKIGAKLIEESFNRARELGYSAVFLVGDPEYYSRFGFKTLSEFGIENKSEIPDKFVMGCELYKGALLNKKGSLAIV